MKKISIFSIFLCLSFGYGCSSTKKNETQNAPPEPKAIYTDMEKSPLISVLTIPVQITTDELERAVNAYVSGLIYEDNSYDSETGLWVKAEKKEAIKLTLYDNTLKYRVPLNIWIKKKLMLGSAEAEGALALNFKTEYQVQEDWSVSTVTTIEYHEWLQKPALKTGLGDISIQWLADYILGKAKSDLSTQIDKMVATQLNLKTAAESAWASIQEPVLLSEEYKMWVKTTPETIGMSPFVSEFGKIEAKIGVHCITAVNFGTKPTVKMDRKLPNLRFVENLPEGYKVRIATSVPYSEANVLAKNAMLGQTFESGRRSVRIEDVEVYGQAEKMVVKTELSGAYTGAIYFTGIPYLNEKKNQIELRDLDFEVDTKSFLMRSAAWLFQGTIRRKMEENMRFPLAESIEALKKQASEALSKYEIQPGVLLNGTVQAIQVENTYLTKDGIQVNLIAVGDIVVKVQGL